MRSSRTASRVAPRVQVLARVIDASVDGMLGVDDRGFVVVANPSAARLLGRDLDGLIGSEFGLPVNLNVTTDIELVRADGPRTVAMRASQLTLDDGSLVSVVALHDVSARVRAEQALRESMRVREELVAIASHEIRSPLAVISGMAATLRDQYDRLDVQARRQLIDRVADRANELAELATVMLDRAASGTEITADVERVVVMPVIERALEPFPDLDIRVDVAADAEVLVDESQLLEIFVNLVDNARKYGAPPVTIAGTVVDTWFELRVTDEGDGVRDEFVDTLFDSFSRSDEATSGDQPGVGLGLAIVRKLVSANSGSIRYERAPSGGACFVVRLPNIETASSPS